MTGDGHRHTFRDAGSHHVPDSRPSEVVKKLLSDLRLFARLLPSTRDLLDLFPLVMEQFRTESG